MQTFVNYNEKKNEEKISKTDIYQVRSLWKTLKRMKRKSTESICITDVKEDLHLQNPIIKKHLP